MKKSPLVSIVMTAYNEAHVVDEAIRTLLAQTHKRIELVLVDDASTDGTAAVFKRYAKDPRVRIILLRKNQGPGGGRNAGARVAKGDILVFIDADMVFDRKYIAMLIRPIIEGKVHGTFHDTELVKNNHNVWARAFSLNRVQDAPLWGGIFRAVTREKYEESGGFDPRRGYFDDALRGIGRSLRTRAVCYHNNPERLGEVLRHSRWVGRSLIREPQYRARFTFGVIASWLWLLAILISLLAQSWGIAAVLALAAAAGSAVFLLWKGCTRAVAEGYLEFVVTVPIVWAVRVLGYWLGASAQLIASWRR